MPPRGPCPRRWPARKPPATHRPRLHRHGHPALAEVARNIPERAALARNGPEARAWGAHEPHSTHPARFRAARRRRGRAPSPPRASAPFAAAVPGAAAAPVLSELPYGDVTVDSALHRAQLENTHEVLMNLSEDSLLKPFRQMAGQPRAGRRTSAAGTTTIPTTTGTGTMRALRPVRPSASGCRRSPATMRSRARQPARAKVLRLNRLYAATIGDGFYDKNRFPAYCYDKLLLGLIDSQALAGDGDAVPHPRAHHRVRRSRTCRRTRSTASCRGGPARISRIAGMSPTPIPRTCSSPIGAAPADATAISRCASSTTRAGSTRSRAARTCSPASMPTATSTPCRRRCRPT